MSIYRIYTFDELQPLVEQIDTYYFGWQQRRYIWRWLRAKVGVNADIECFIEMLGQEFGFKLKP